VLRPTFDLAADYFDRDGARNIPHTVRQLMITGYGALLSCFSDKAFLEGLLDIARCPTTPPPASTSQFFRPPCCPEP
jgi:hypothetical protein